METRLAGAMLAVLVAAGCGTASTNDSAGQDPDSPSASAPTATPTPDEAGLREAAAEVGARFAAQDFTGYYDLWTSAAQAETTRDEYAAAAKACGQGGAPTEVEDVRIEPDGSGVVRVGAMGMSNATHYQFEDGEWRLDPDRQRLKAVLAGNC